MENFLRILGQKLIRSKKELYKKILVFSHFSTLLSPILLKEKRIGEIVYYLQYILFIKEKRMNPFQLPEKHFIRSYLDCSKDFLNKEIWEAAENLYFRLRRIATEITTNEKNALFISESPETFTKEDIKIYLNVYLNEEYQRKYQEEKARNFIISEDGEDGEDNYEMSNLLSWVFIRNNLRNIANEISILDEIRYNERNLNYLQNIQLYMLHFLYIFFFHKYQLQKLS